MDRTIPKTGSEEIQLYMRTYYSLLRSTDAVSIETLVESHTAMGSSLHIGAGETGPDISALIYSALRLPACITDVQDVVVAQLEHSFVQGGYTDVVDWQRVYAPGRRRRMHYNGQDTLAVYVVSRSDIDDLVPMLTAYQIEWNKLHFLLQGEDARHFLAANRDRSTALTRDEADLLAAMLKVDPYDLQRLEIVWQPGFIAMLHKIASARKSMTLRMISGSLADYRRGTAYWWRELHETMLGFGVDLEQRPVYFVSSNTHSLVNLLTGFARRQEENILAYIKSRNAESLLAEYADIQQGGRKSLENFLYYVLRNYLSETGEDAWKRLVEDERSVGIYRLPSRHGFEIESQVIDIGQFRREWLDPRLSEGLELEPLSRSDAVILNIDYPLGLAAYELLTRITEQVGSVLGVFIMGKAATLNGRISDVMIPNVVHDEHSQNTYLFNNCFSARHVRPHMTYGNVLDNQKAITAPGTFLQNPGYMSVFYHEGYTDIEMEAGPYLSAVYEAFRPKRHPVNEIVNLYGLPFDIGMLHYASDTPMKKGENLGAGSLNYSGIESTYAVAIAILRHIFQTESRRVLQRAALRTGPGV